MTRPIRRYDDDKLLEELARAERDVAAIAQEHGLTVTQLLQWASRPRNHRLFTELERLNNAQARMVLSRWRMHVAHRLAELAMNPKVGREHETSRKACVDVLRVTVDEPSPPEPPARRDAQYAALRSLLVEIDRAYDAVSGIPNDERQV